MKNKSVGAYYTGAFPVGGPVLRVKILQEVGRDDPNRFCTRFRVKVTARKASPVWKGLEMEVEYRDLWDKFHCTQGPKIVMKGKAWYKQWDESQKE